MTTVRNLAASERGGIDRRHAVAADNEGSDRAVGRKEARRNSREIGQIPSRPPMRSVTGTQLMLLLLMGD